MSLVVDHFDLERKINCLLDFGVNGCYEEESLHIALVNDTPGEQVDVSVRYGIPKEDSASWNEQECMEYCQARLRTLKSYLKDEFGLQHYRTDIVSNIIWAYCRVFTVASPPPLLPSSPLPSQQTS